LIFSKEESETLNTGTLTYHRASKPENDKSYKLHPRT
jgi:hypothetical protein